MGKTWEELGEGKYDQNIWHEEILNKKKKNILKFRTMGNFQGRYKHGTRQKWFCFPNNQRVSLTRSVPLALRTL